MDTHTIHTTHNIMAAYTTHTTHGTPTQMEHTVGLKFMPNEDATFGFWVSGLNLRHVDHPKIKTTAGHCSFQFINAEVREAGGMRVLCFWGCGVFWMGWLQEVYVVIWQRNTCLAITSTIQNSMARFVDASFREEEDVCAGWLLCHKIMTSREMRYMHYR